jgi:hypothetical protein
MRRTWESILSVLLAAVVCLFPLVTGGQEPSSSAISKGATALAKQYLGAIERTVPFRSAQGGRQNVIFVGQSLKPPRGWRVIAVADQEKPQVVWDSFALHDAYLDVTGVNSINTEADGPNGYIVTLRGCVPHQCSDGRIGFALYASQKHLTYRAHVSTQEDDSYRVTYYPNSGIPEMFREKLDKMICSDNGITRPSALPIKCSAP